MLGCILPTPDAPGQRAFSRCVAPFFLEIRQYSCEKTSCSAQKFLAAGHIESFQIHPREKRIFLIPRGARRPAPDAKGRDPAPRGGCRRRT